jgi:hypothetical protein
MVAILELDGGADLASDVDVVGAEGRELPFCPSLAFCLAIRSCSICALPDSTGGSVGAVSTGVAMFVEFDESVERDRSPGSDSSGSPTGTSS